MGWPVRRLIGVALVCGLAQAAHAQAPIVCTADCQVVVGAPFTAFAQVATDAVSYRIFFNEIVSSPNPGIVNGFVEFLFASGWPVSGVYYVLIEATLSDGQTLLTKPLRLSVVAPLPPPPPSGCLVPGATSPLYAAGATYTDRFRGGVGAVRDRVAQFVAQKWVLLSQTRLGGRNVSESLSGNWWDLLFRCGG